MVAEVDILDPMCVIFSSLDEREHDTGDDELPVKQDGQACQGSSVRGLDACGQGKSASKTGRSAQDPGADNRVSSKCKTQFRVEVEVQVQDGQTCRSRSVEGVLAGDQGRSVR
jgi:hypothetical protein